MKKILSAVFLLFSSVLIFAEDTYFDNYVCRIWNSFGGLTGTTATDIFQTTDGYINIGTYEGLVRFDGLEFTTLRRSRDNDLKFASVRTILEDRHGNLWIGANDEGVQKISQDGNKHYNMETGLPNNSVRALCEDLHGNIWIGTASGIAYLTPAGHLITPQFQAGTVSKGVLTTSLYCDTAGRVWLITGNEKGLFVYKDGLFYTLPELDQYGNYFCTAIAQDLNGDFWLAMGNLGLFKISNGYVRKVTTGKILDESPTWSIYTATDGTIWFGCEKGIVVYSNGVFSEYKGNGKQIAKINKITCDREGGIWFATDRNGVGRLTHGKFRVTKLGTAANAITEDLHGRYWVGTDNGVRCYVENKEVQNKLTEYTKGIRIRHVGIALNGDILVSCYKKPGQLRYNIGTGNIKSWTTDNGLVGDKVRVAIETNPDELYVGTTTGLSIISPNGEIKSLKQLDGLENEYVMCIYKDTNGVVWVGTDGGGIFLMKNGAIISHISSEDGLIGNVIFKISQDKHGVYWVCTGTGISRIHPFDSVHSVPAKYENLNSEQGLGTDSVFQIIPDTAGDVWITSNYGIASAHFNDFVDAASGVSESIDIKFYNRNDGLDSDGPTSTALSICDSRGRMWFTMVDGFAVYDPLKIKENPVSPLVHIETVKIDNLEYKKPRQEIALKPGTKRVDIKFTGISFDAPERIQFAHRLTNFEDSFGAPDSKRVVSYTNLKPGKHTFLVSAINGDGLFSQEAVAMLFVQKPYFYQMPVFWIISLILFLAIITLIFYLKQRAIKLENIRLENMVQIRTAELAQEKDKSDYLLRSILPDKIAEELRDNIHSIGEDFSDVTLLFSDIVGFTKTSSGHTANEIVSALNDLFSRFDERAKRMGVEKIKTIGDSYMAACGVPSPKERHAEIMVEFAKGMYKDLADYNKTAEIQFNIRVGLNCGPVTAGVIGKTKFIYDVWGNTVNVASRMETACTPGKIRVSKAMYDHLKDTNITFTEPMECDIKGKGKMVTYEIVE
ncbi:adenylate/guanylate cyclase domain-containing protein [Treponema sp.]|uniref:adenylate/guanylate cyclase domain-containing protein n=1 Tax=Treponema sp. TaxID=166 RepID=UPI00388CFB5F